MADIVDPFAPQPPAGSTGGGIIDPFAAVAPAGTPSIAGAAPKKPGFFDYLKRGALAEVGTLGRGVNELTRSAFPPEAQDQLLANLTAGLPPSRAPNAAQQASDAALARIKTFSDPYAPTAAENSSVSASVARGIGGLAVDLPTILASPVRAAAGGVGFLARAVHGALSMAPVAAAHGAAREGELVDQGVDAATAQKAGLVTAATTTAMGAVPVALAGGLVKRAVTGAIGGAATGEAGRIAQNAVLPSDKQTPFTATGLATSAVTGALLGGIMGSPQKVQNDAALGAAKADVDAGAPLMITNQPETLINFPDGSTGTRAQADAYINSFPAAEQVAVRARLFGLGEQPNVAPEAPPAAEPLRLTDQSNTPETLISFPDGTLGTRSQVDDYVAQLPADQQVAARAKLLGFGEQPNVAPAAPEAPPAAEPLRLTDQSNTPEPLVAFPDGSLATQAQADAHINALPENQRVAARAQLLGFGAEDRPAPPDTSLNTTWKQQVSDASIDATGLRGQYLAKLNKTVQGVDALGAVSDKIQALETARDKSNSTTVTYSIYDTLAKNLRAQQDAVEPPPVVAAKVADVTPQIPEQPAAVGTGTLPTAAASSAPVEQAAQQLQANTPPPASSEPVPAAGDIAAPNTSVRDNAQAAADRIDATLADFNTRIRAGEQLTPLEQERYDDAQTFRSTLADNLSGNKRGSDDYLTDITDYANQAASGPYAKSFRSNFAPPENPQAFSEPIARQLVQPNTTANDVLAHLAGAGSQPWVKDLAAKLQGLGLKTTIGRSGGDLADGAQGQYNGIADHVDIAAGGVNEHVVLHELTHAATVARLNIAEEIGTPRNQQEAQLQKAYKGIDQIRRDALKRATADDHYGLTDNKEFLAELNTNPEFQKFLSSKNLWQKTVDAVRGLLGLEPNSKTALDKALGMQEGFFSSDTYKDYLAAQTTARERNADFNASYKGAKDVTDNSLTGLAKAIDTIANKVSIKGMDMAAFRFLSGAKTVQYMADRVRALPDMVAAGMDKGVDGYMAAHAARREAAMRAESAPAEFTSRVGKLFKGMDNDKARTMNTSMAEIGTGSSIGGFDPTLNFADNLKTRPDLSPTNKPYIDDINRKFTQLRSSDPEAAKAIVEGAKINRLGYIQDMASVVRNLINSPTNAGGQLRQHAAGLDFMDKGLDAQRNGNPSQHLNGASFALDGRLRAAFADAAKLPAGGLHDQMAELQNAYGNLIDNPYYSAGRQGNYFVNVGFKDMDDATWGKVKTALNGTNKVLGDYTNQDHAFFRVDSSDQAAGLRNKLLAALGDKVDMPKVASGALADKANINSAAGISQALRGVLSGLHDAIDANPGLQGPQAQLMKEAMTRKFLSMLPETSTKLATIKRMGVPGYDGDFLGNFTRRASGAVQDTANIYAAQRFSDAFKSMGDAVDNLSRTGTPEMQEKARVVADEINLRHANSMQPVENSVVNTINSMGHSFYLAAAPAFYIRTMAQPWHRAIPILGSRYGFVNSAKELAAATPTALRIMKASIAQGWQNDGINGVVNAGMKFKDMGLSPTDEAFVQELHDRGVLKLGQAQELQKLVIGGDSKTQDLVRAAAMTAQYAEMTNRLITGLSAFRLAQKGKTGITQKGIDANTDYATRAIDLAMDNFDSANTARAIGKNGFAGKVTPLMTQFMNYNMQTMQQIARTVHDGYFNRDPSAEGVQRAGEAKKELGALFATTAMLSGAMGLPFANAFAGVYNMLTSDEDDPSDIRNDARNGLSDMFGQQVGNVLSHGIGAAVGVDTSTFGLQNLLPGSEFLASRRLMKDRLADQSQALMGPALNGAIDIVEAASKMSDGQYVKGLESALPSGLKGYFKAWNIAQKGYTDAKGNPIGLPATPWDVAVQATGLRPSDKAIQAEAQQYSIEDQELRQHRSGVIRDEFLKATTAKDPEAIADATSDVKAYNAKNPLTPITQEALVATIRQNAMLNATGARAGTGVGATTARMMALQEQRLRFAKGMP